MGLGEPLEPLGDCMGKRMGVLQCSNFNIVNEHTHGYQRATLTLVHTHTYTCAGIKAPPRLTTPVLHDNTYVAPCEEHLQWEQCDIAWDGNNESDARLGYITRLRVRWWLLVGGPSYRCGLCTCACVYVCVCVCVCVWFQCQSACP